jgi:hypothetical protein
MTARAGGPGDAGGATGRSRRAGGPGDAGLGGRRRAGRLLRYGLDDAGGAGRAKPEISGDFGLEYIYRM